MLDPDKKWFLFNEGKVTGPMTSQDVEDISLKAKTPLVWGRGMPEWSSIDKWKRTFSATQVQFAGKTTATPERMWKVLNQGREMPAMPYSKMMDFLRSLEDLGEVRIWTEGYLDWKEVYQIHKVLDDLGVSRRAHPRVPIMGTVTLENPNQTITTRMLSISEGGMGVADAKNVLIGEKYKITIKSPNLFAPVHAIGEVVFVGDDNYAGLKFVGLPQEPKSAIVEYVKKFTEVKKVADQKQGKRS